MEEYIVKPAEIVNVNQGEKNTTLPQKIFKFFLTNLPYFIVVRATMQYPLG